MSKYFIDEFCEHLKRKNTMIDLNKLTNVQWNEFDYQPKTGQLEISGSSAEGNWFAYLRITENLPLEQVERWLSDCGNDFDVEFKAGNGRK